MRVVVTGVNGFVGQHLTRELAHHGHDVIGMGLGHMDADIEPFVTDYLSVDLRRRWPSVECDAVVHLAALSAVGPSFNDPQRYIESNSAPVTHLGESFLLASKRVRIVVVSTGAVYGARRTGLRDEKSPTVPTSPYIVSKLVTEAQCQYYRQRGLDVLIMRPFNHLGPGQSRGFLLPDLLDGVTSWMTTGSSVRAGDLSTRRDYTDVRDVARAYRFAVEAPTVGPPVLNVCSGRTVSGLEMLQMIEQNLAITLPAVEIDEAKIRPEDPEEVCGDNSAIRQALGWQPSIAISQSVRDTMHRDGLIRG